MQQTPCDDRPRRRSARDPAFQRAALALVLPILCFGPVGCKDKMEPVPQAPPTATYTGPTYLYNSIGSLCRLSNHLPQPVQGYGIVVDLEGTGSSEVPDTLRRWLINEMNKYGVGATQFRELLPASPEELLASTDTAVVDVRGLIPGGAIAGDRFDLLVTAADTRTTSLVGGRLWTTEMAAGLTNPGTTFATPLAEARGSIYIDPLDEQTGSDPRQREQLQRRAVIVSGGEVLKTRTIQLILNQPNRRRAADIAAKINERYPKYPDDKYVTANAVSPVAIDLSIPRNYRDRPELFIDLVMHTYIDRSPGFIPFQARKLADELLADPAKARPVTLAWTALGPQAQPVLRGLYTHENLNVRLPALEAGAAIGDEGASEHLLHLASNQDPEVRIRVAEALIELPNSYNGTRALRTLLDDHDPSVRIAAYESLAQGGHALIDRTVIRENGHVKMLIDRLPVKEPLIYVTQKRVPRLVIFGPQLGFETPTMASVWDGRLMVRRTTEDQPAEMFFQHPVVSEGRKVLQADKHAFYPTVATLAYILAHEPTVLGDPQPGFNLSYGQVVDAVYQLTEVGAIDSPIVLDRSMISRMIDRQNNPAPTPDRPETAPIDPTPPPVPAPEETAARRE